MISGASTHGQLWRPRAAGLFSKIKEVPGRDASQPRDEKEKCERKLRSSSGLCSVHTPIPLISAQRAEFPMLLKRGLAPPLGKLSRGEEGGGRLTRGRLGLRNHGTSLLLGLRHCSLTGLSETAIPMMALVLDIPCPLSGVKYGSRVDGSFAIAVK